MDQMNDVTPKYGICMILDYASCVKTRNALWCDIEIIRAKKELHPAGKINQYMPPRVCVVPPSSAWTWIPSTCIPQSKSEELQRIPV